MKKFIYPLLSAFPLLYANSANGIEVTANPFGSVNAVVSNTEPNVIHVKNDVITSITAKSGAVIQDQQSSDGSVMFSTLETKPFSVLIETEKGFTFTLRATPRKTENSSSIVIYNLEDKGNDTEEIQNRLSHYQSYSGLISKILTDLINEKIPDGFVESRKTRFKVDSSVTSVLGIRNVQTWVGQNMRVVKLDITNTSMSEVELNERYLWNKDVMAISYYPRVSVLRPNTRIFAYVVLKEVD